MSPRISVQPAPFDVGAEMAALTGGEQASGGGPGGGGPGGGGPGGGGQGVGGLGCFVGVVRGGGGLRALSLEHYPGMTERAIARIASEAESRFDLLGCTVIHRIGALPVGDPIVLVLAAAAHRQAALDATGFLIDWLKTRAPFWKREIFNDGSGRWVEARALDEDASARWDQSPSA